MELKSPSLSSIDLAGYSNLDHYISAVDELPIIRKEGRVLQVIGHMVEATNPGCSVGGTCQIYNPENQVSVKAEVVGFREDRILVMPLRNSYGVGPKCRIIPEENPSMIPVGDGLLGRVIDPLMRPLDGLGEISTSSKISLYPEVINPLKRERIKQSLDVGIRSINSCLTCGRGQRIGIMAGSGLGK